MYRAQSDANYPVQNVNAADLAGVLWYLHNEVVHMCPRKYSITRVLRLRVAVRRPMTGYMAFDMGKCTVPGCDRVWRRSGYAVGCQVVPYGGSPAVPSGIPGNWYSLPGPCPSRENGLKDQACMAAQPGGACRGAWNDRCTYMVEHAGEVRLDELTGIRNYTAFCQAGNLEYSPATDSGIHFSFWDGKFDLSRCRQRYDALLAAFRRKYPNEPRSAKYLDEPDRPGGEC